ncbi:MAG: hypothetical protein AAF213_05715 [Pseudomonadota bacterium]
MAYVQDHSSLPTAAPRPLVGVITTQDSLVTKLGASLPDVELLKLDYALDEHNDLSAFAYLLIDFDELSLEQHVNTHQTALKLGFSGDVFGLAQTTDAALDRHVRLLHRRGVFVHSDDTDLSLLRVTIDTALRKAATAEAPRQRGGIAQTAREIAGLIRVWNTRLKNERLTMEQRK